MANRCSLPCSFQHIGVSSTMCLLMAFIEKQHNVTHVKGDRCLEKHQLWLDVLNHELYFAGRDWVVSVTLVVFNHNFLLLIVMCKSNEWKKPGPMGGWNRDSCQPELPGQRWDHVLKLEKWLNCVPNRRRPSSVLCLCVASVTCFWQLWLMHNVWSRLK